jgi:hypothetical protein
MDRRTEIMTPEDSDHSQLTDNSDSDSSLPSVKRRKCRGVRFLTLHHMSHSDEYMRRRVRNNSAVRKSREKSRHEQHEQQRRLVELTQENQLLQKKAELLLKEIVVLKGLFPTFGIVPPPEIDMIIPSE